MDRPKMGFGIPMVEWFGDELKKYVLEYVSDENLRKVHILNFIDAKKIRQSWMTNHRLGVNKIWLLFFDVVGEMEVSKKEICIILPSLSGGGAEKVGVVIANALQQRGWRVILLVISGKNKKNEWMINDKVEYHTLNTPVILSFFKLMNFIKTYKIKKILSFSIEISGFFILMRKLFRMDFVLITRVMSVLSEYDKNIQIYWKFLNLSLLNKVSLKSDVIVAQSMVIKQDLIENFGVEEDRIALINNPAFLMADINSNDINNINTRGLLVTNNYILFIGRFSKEKNVKFLLEVFKAVKEKIQNPIYLYLVGEGKDKSAIENYINHNKLNDFVRIFSFTKNVSLFYKHAQFTVLTSYYEGFSNVLLESISVGTPIVAFDKLGGVEEMLIDGVNGYRVKYLDKEDLTEKLIMALDTKWDKAKIIESSKRFALDKIVVEYEKLLLNNV